MNREIQALIVLIAAFVASPVQAQAGGFNPAMGGHRIGPMMHMMPRHAGYERPRMMYRPGPRIVYGPRFQSRYFVGRPEMFRGGGFVGGGGYGDLIEGGVYGGGGTRIESFHIHTEQLRHFEGGGPIVERHIVVAPRVIEEPCAPRRHRVRVHIVRSAPRPACDCCGCRERQSVVQYRTEPTYDQQVELPVDPPAPAPLQELTQDDLELLNRLYK